MSKLKYYYDTKTCKYEPIKATRKEVVLNVLMFFGISLCIAAGLIYMYHENFSSVKEIKLHAENQSLHYNFDHLKSKVKLAEEQLAALQVKDDSIYRVILDIEPVPSTAREAGIGGTDRHQDLISQNLEEEALLLGTYSEIDKLKNKLDIQASSYDELIEIEKEKEKMWASRPAIQPLSNKKLMRIASGFKKKRYHPILKVNRPHYGLDFRAAKGTPIYATGDGKIKTRHYSHSFGNVIYIDHGYGYETVYAHLSKFNVKKDQIVKRGDCIGYLGNTGLSVAPHLHYEIHFKGNPVNPINFFHRDLSNEEYDKLIEISSNDDTILDYH